METKYWPVFVLCGVIIIVMTKFMVMDSNAPMYLWLAGLFLAGYGGYLANLKRKGVKSSGDKKVKKN